MELTYILRLNFNQYRINQHRLNLILILQIHHRWIHLALFLTHPNE